MHSSREWQGERRMRYSRTPSFLLRKADGMSFEGSAGIFLVLMGEVQ